MASRRACARKRRGGFLAPPRLHGGQLDGAAGQTLLSAQSRVNVLPCASLSTTLLKTDLLVVHRASSSLLPFPLSKKKKRLSRLSSPSRREFSTVRWGTRCTGDRRSKPILSKSASFFLSRKDFVSKSVEGGGAPAPLSRARACVTERGAVGGKVWPDNARPPVVVASSHP